MGKIYDSLSRTTNDNVDVQRRSFIRRSSDTCLATVNGVPYPVKDWSLSGILIEADTRTFQEGQNLPMTIKFNVGTELINVDVTGTIVRKNARYVATQFDPLPSQVQQVLHEVVDKATLYNLQNRKSQS